MRLTDTGIFIHRVHYFRTSIPGAGIFLPVHRAERRNSPSLSLDSFPPTPGTPSGRRGDHAFTPPTPAVPPKFSQSVGPGVRPSSPTFKPKRPSIPRPESPLRKNAPVLAPTPGRALSASVRGGRAPALPTTTPSKTNMRASTNSRPSTSNGQTPRPYSRTGSRLGNDEDRTPVGIASTANGRTGSVASVPSFSQPLRPSSRLGSAGGSDSEILRLKAELAERDKRLAEQAASLSDMEASVKELSGLLPTDGPTPQSAQRFSLEGNIGDAAQLRQMLREKNEKITLLTSEFDAHRADFRSTLDSLEMASTETERVYEEQKRDLLAQVEQMGDRIQELEEMNSSKKDFEDVARQLKGLEEFVQELEEGLEDARRGEAEARGEVEFLRGEVERCRSELRREREKSAAAAGIGQSKELEQKEDEIRGLKAIIQSLSTGDSTGAAANGAASALDTNELSKAQAALAESNKEKERLEQELEQLRRDAAAGSTANGGHARNESEQTAKLSVGGGTRSRANTVKATFVEHARRAAAAAAMDPPPPPPQTTTSGALAGDHRQAGGARVYCEMCESTEHDTFDCTHFQNTHEEASTEDGDDDLAASAVNPLALKTRNVLSAGAATVAPLSPGKENKANGTSAGAGKPAPPAADNDKWCALCEKDGHLAYECPDEI